MFKEEAKWIKKVLSEIGLSSIRTCLNVGSGSLTFRTKIQPWIGELFKELEKYCEVFHLDISHTRV